MFKRYSLLLYFILLTHLNAANVNVSSDNEIESDDTSNKYIFDAADQTLTIKSGVTAGASSASQNIQTTTKDNATVIIESGATLQGTNTLIKGNDADGLTVTNSGTISASTNRAINLLDATNATITNNSGATISSETGNTINGAVNNDSVSGNTITNSGTIYATSGVAVRFYNTSTSTTITNDSGGVIYNNGNDETIRLGGSSTLTNAGKIENKKDPSKDAIDIEGNSSTITLKDGGIVIGKIRSAGTSNTLKIQHGVGQSYFYETAGNDMTLQDLDGNQIVKGSASSVGQGGSETQDELLGYKSLNIRKSLNRYKKNKDNLDKNKGWGETYGSFVKRDQNNTNLSLGYNFLNLGVNLVYPLEKSDHILSFETGRQEFTKDHNINHFSFLSGLNFYNMNSETFILGGVTLHESERTILTNTTTTGKLDLNDTYYSLKSLTGLKFNNKKLIPNIGFTTGYSFTPEHSESKYYTWKTKQIINLSTYIEDEYNFIILNKKNNFNIGWGIDFRKLVLGKKQNYKINGTNATYTQDEDLTKEVIFSANAEFIKKFSNSHKLSFALDGFLSTQETSGLEGSIYYIMKL
tara:strand:+ start:270 stop:2015 length:1746 start_codon:yes stop_codon:yes gene_type:complete